MLARVLTLVFVVGILALPFAMRAGQEHRHASSAGDGVPAVLIVTPHAEQLRVEFAEGFARWHERVYGEPARAELRQPGGTREIQNQLRAEYSAAVKAGSIRADGSAEVGAVAFDLFFGGGTYEHGRLASPDAIRVAPPGQDEPIELTMSVPAGFDEATLREWYGDREMAGTEPVHHPEQLWLGTALSSFGIVFNKDVLLLRGIDEPDGFEDLADPRLLGWVALADPRLSGSVVTTMDSVLGNYGWEKGWRVLRGMCANTRYFTGSSTKPPSDVAQGEAAAGLAIDFYGRAQAQAVLPKGAAPGDSRVGYVDPKGSVYVDPDPISLLRGAPNPELARRFIRFVMSEEGQAIWQFPAIETGAGASNPLGPDGEPMGPRRFELRRLPIRPSLYEKYFDVFIDKVNLYELASDTRNPGWRTGVEFMLGVGCIDSTHEQRAAWSAINRARDAGLGAPAIEALEDAFFAWPAGEDIQRVWSEMFSGDGVDLPADALLEWNEQNYRAIRNTWRDPAVARRLQIVYTRLFREMYESVEDQADAARASASKGAPAWPTTAE